mmetsp:Transcript_47473/g.100874  ORF Transcript_47473/g.100874 Transcript_47473/m.100874 type:complete len:218 (-) Transcript_47473:62-715(-)
MKGSSGRMLSRSTRVLRFFVWYPSKFCCCDFTSHTLHVIVMISRQIIYSALIVRPVIPVQLDIGRQLCDLTLPAVLPVHPLDHHYVVTQIGQPVHLPRGLVLLQGLPLHHALPHFVLLQKSQLGVQVHLLQVHDRPAVGGVPLNAQRLETVLHLVVLAPPSPERVGIPVDALHVLLREGDDAPEVLGVVGVPVPDSCYMQRFGREHGVRIAHVGLRQ